MTAAIDPTAATASIDELLAAYADHPTSLTAAERAAVEARLAGDPGAAGEVEAMRGLLAEVRAVGDVADRGTDWDALGAGIRAAVGPTAPPRRRPWLAGAGVALATAAALAVWWSRRGDAGPGLDVAGLTAIARAPLRPSPLAPDAAPAPLLDDTARARVDEAVAGAAGAIVRLAADDAATDPDAALALDEADDIDDLLAGADDGDHLDEEALIGRALEPVPAPADEEGLLPGLDTEWVDELSETEVEQALRWLDQQGAG